MTTFAAKFCFSFVNIVYFNGKGILLVRNPFRAVLSAFRHNKFGVHANSDYGLKKDIVSALMYQGQGRNRINIAEFEQAALKHIVIWREIVENWVKLGEVLVVHYEDVVDDKVAEVERILGFLKLTPDKRRIDCMRYATLDFYKRHSGGGGALLYSKELSRVFRENIERVDKLLIQYGHRGIPYSKYSLP